MALVWTLIILETINRFLTFVIMNCSLNDFVTQEKFVTFLVYTIFGVDKNVLRKCFNNYKVSKKSAMLKSAVSVLCCM